jgi:hypothetical protein
LAVPGGSGILGLADQCLLFINETAKRPRSLNYNKSFIGLTEGGRANNFVWFNPKKSFLGLGAGLDPAEPWEKLLESAGLDFKNRNGDLRVDSRPKISPRTAS